MHPSSLYADKGLWTRVNRNKPTEKSVLDYILTHNNLKDQVKSLIIDEEGDLRIREKKDSDHNTITMTIELQAEKVSKKVISWKKGNKQKWQNFYDDIHNRMNAKN